MGRGRKLLLLGVLLSAVAVRAATVTLGNEYSSRRILIDGVPTWLKGVNYAPVPIGEFPGSSNVFNNSAIIDRDVALLKSMGVNCIRTYGMGSGGLDAHRYLLDQLYTNSIYIIIGYWVDYSLDLTSSTVRDTQVSNFVSVVNTYKSHPAVIGWLFGNELNLQYSSRFPELFGMIASARDAAHAAEGSSWKPVMSSMGDGSVSTVLTNYDSSVDIWAYQLYRGTSFFDFFETYVGLSEKPLLITEYGIDALNGATDTEYESVHNSSNTGLLLETISNFEICQGSFFFEYVDEWWKAGAASSHDTTGSSTSGPDNEGNEEWYGMFRVADSGVSVDILTPRSVVTSFSNIFQALENPYSSEIEDSSQTTATTSESMASSAYRGFALIFLTTLIAIMLSL